MSAERPVTGEPPLRTATRVAGLAGLLYAVLGSTRPGTSGRHLAALLLALAVAAGWGGWLLARRRDDVRAGVVCLVVLSLSGGALSVLGPVGAAVITVSGLGAASMLAVGPATAVPAVGVVTAAVGVAIAGHSFVVVGGAAAGALAGVAFGTARRQQQAWVRQSAELALARERSEIEHDRAEILTERNRIAREVHDVLAHSLSALSVQLAALDSLLDGGADSAAVRAGVRRSRRLVVEGLEETRRVVRVLRDEPVDPAEQIAALAGAGGATLAVDGQARTLPPATGLALVRVAQEALTNVRKHAAGADVRVRLTFGDQRTTLVVDDDGVAGASPLAATGAGYGLRGMRERVELVGGTLQAGPFGAGWRVRADVPA